MKSETKLKLSQMGFTTLEINALEQLPYLINTVNEVCAKIKEIEKKEDK